MCIYGSLPRPFKYNYLKTWFRGFWGGFLLLQFDLCMEGKWGTQSRIHFSHLTGKGWCWPIHTGQVHGVVTSESAFYHVFIMDLFLQTASTSTGGVQLFCTASSTTWAGSLHRTAVPGDFLTGHSAWELEKQQQLHCVLLSHGTVPPACSPILLSHSTPARAFSSSNFRCVHGSLQWPVSFH